MTTSAISQERADYSLTSAYKLLECSAYYGVRNEIHKPDEHKPIFDYGGHSRLYRKEGELHLVQAGKSINDAETIVPVFISISTALLLNESYIVSLIYAKKCSGMIL
ncbi:hypothetical protein AB4Y96_09265 [Phyllobacterium sp. TAF24]|uniref:hypothetical protein n=1 Tax=Phyllobacterium sp. TAF24 TaxID=3233068 RepID=UPI003F950784